MQLLLCTPFDSGETALLYHGQHTGVGMMGLRQSSPRTNFFVFFFRKYVFSVPGMFGGDQDIISARTIMLTAWIVTDRSQRFVARK